MKSYIGITGYEDRQSIQRSLAIMDGDHSERLLMVGVLMTLTTLEGGVKTNRPHRYPPLSNLPELFVAHPRALNLIHYATPNRDELAKQLESIVSLMGSNLNGFQINVNWPNVNQLIEIKQHHPQLDIILQCGGIAMSQCSNNPALIAEVIASYEDAITGVLFDPSGGTGEAFDPEFARNCVMSIKSACPHLTYIGVAGGLTPSNVSEFVSPLLAVESKLSWDIETGVRDEADHYVPNLGDAFLRASLALH